MPTWRARVLSPQTSTTTTWLDDAVVVVDKGVITHVGPYDGRLCDDDLRPGVLLPGFVDAHVHFPQTRIVGSASGPLLEWLRQSTFPEEERFADLSHAAAVAGHFVRRLAASGTTLSLAYGSVHAEAADVLFQAMDVAGLRTIAGPVLMDANAPAALLRGPDRALSDIEGLIQRWNGHDGRLSVALIPRFALSCTREMLHRAGRLAANHDLWVSTHLSENLEECRVARELFDAHDYLSIYEDAGMVHAKSVYAHCIHLSDSEWERFAAARAIVAHCPDSNDFLGSGSMPIDVVLEHGIPLAIGTDIAAGRSFRVPRILSSAYDNGLRRGLTLTPSELFWHGTRGGALALGHGHVGQVRTGLEADLCLFKPPPWADSAESVLAALMFDHDAGPMARTWVRGRLVWEA